MGLLASAVTQSDLAHSRYLTEADVGTHPAQVVHRHLESGAADGISGHRAVA